MTTPVPLERIFISGGAGFIGSFFVDRLLADTAVRRVTVYDNLSSGSEWHLEPHANDERLRVVRDDLKNERPLASAMEGHDTVIHLASNPDIAKAMTDPTIDFVEGTLLTHNVVEAMRRTGVHRILYASGSGVYGDLGETEADEDYGPLIPVSTYGASKLAGEALISSYAFMFDMQGAVFRFGNVVGGRQTHGVGFDFVHRLLQDRGSLRILGDGTQSKSYIDVDDVIGAVLLVAERQSATFRAYNIATGDYITVREIADLAVEVVGLRPADVRYTYTGGNRGWKGDVPVVRLKTDRIRELGWSNRLNSREALRASMQKMIPLVHSGAI
ncbi:MAG: NAD-dependent epimerase/dehydratase family protein [Candidatus Dormibacteraeota bacterium]|nr:NAD-dependent epimerase/dehydratase family protein [Candidatus Dormibacteraeota bacterium]